MRFLGVAAVFFITAGGLAVLVVEFQPDGVASLASVGLYRAPLPASRRLPSLTLCGRFKIFFLHGRDTFFNLRDNGTANPYMIKAEVWLEKLRPALAARWNFMLLPSKLQTLTWYHACFAYSAVQKRYTTWLDGVLVSHLDYDIGRDIYGDFALIGQGGEVRESFSGQLSQVNVWDRPLTDEEVANMASCATDMQGNYISWDAGWDLYNVTSKDVPLRHFCEEESSSDYFWFPDLPPVTSNYICESLGTHLPVPETVEESQSWLALASKLVGNATRCNKELIVAANDIKKDGRWIIPYSGEKINREKFAWKDGEPNGLTYENCAQIEPGGVADIDCATRVQCAVCEFKTRQVFSLRGTCEIELRNINFLAYQNSAGELHFRGYGNYQIEKDQNDTWVWLNEVNNRTVATMAYSEPNNFPMGRRLWNLLRPVCGQKEGQRVLLLTPCADHQYSCSDATCIPRDLRCDLKYDCIDRSDEADCEMVVMPSDYRSDLPPRGTPIGDLRNDPSCGVETTTVNSTTQIPPEMSNPATQMSQKTCLDSPKVDTRLPVTLSINIETMTIDTTDMTLHATYTLSLTWRDARLTYLNIKGNDSLNKLPYDTMLTLWHPSVGYVNTQGNQHSSVDTEATLLIVRENDPSHEDDAAPGEVSVYRGADNPLEVSRKYSTEFQCNFDLVLYPFDYQTCDLHFRMLSGSQDYLYFDTPSASAAYEGSSLLIEYQVFPLLVVGVISKEESELKVRVPMSRQYGYAILNIYTPSLILMIISYVTLFFRPRIFEVRVMAALTSLLVVATLFTQVSSSLPKTSYFKMVDIWLLFCIGMIFIIIIFHAVIDRAFPNEDDKLEPDRPITVFTRVTPKSLVQSNPASRKQRVQKLILGSKIVSLAMFVLFNVFYWGFILG